MKILLVEDDQALSEALAASLDEGGLLVEAAATGGEADFLLRTERYDAVVLDLGLPDGDGTRWLAQWRDDDIDLPVLVLTARERWSDKAAGFNEMVSLTSKPSRLCLLGFFFSEDHAHDRSRHHRHRPGQTLLPSACSNSPRQTLVPQGVVTPETAVAIGSATCLSGGRGPLCRKPLTGPSDPGVRARRTADFAPVRQALRLDQ